MMGLWMAGCGFSATVSSETPDIDARATDAQIDATVVTQGDFVIEAEDATRMTPAPSTTWTEIQTPSGYSGTGLMVLEPNAIGCDPTVTPTCALLEFDVTISVEGTYYPFVRMFANNGGHDSLWFAIDANPPQVIDTDENNPMWRWHGATERLLGIGPHTLYVWNRDGNLKLDVVALMSADAPPP